MFNAVFLGSTGGDGRARRTRFPDDSAAAKGKTSHRLSCAIHPDSRLFAGDTEEAKAKDASRERACRVDFTY